MGIFMKNMLKQLVSFLLPVTVTLVIPFFILKGHIYVTGNMWARIIGTILILAGLLGLVLTIKTFILIGKGTLAPWSPTSNLIVGGIYSYMRNPMITSVWAILIGESILFWSRGILIMAVIFFFVNHIYFIKSEEPGLVKRFGKDYEDYKAKVPRWIPRFKNK